MAIGYIFTDQLEMVFGYLERMGSGFLIVLAGLFAAWILWRFIQRRRFLRQLRGARITPDELRDRMKAGEDLYIVDLRGPGENENSIPGAVRISVDELRSNSKRIPPDREVILFCSCPNEAASARVAILLRSKGVTRVRPLLGGSEAWEKMLALRT
jgi:rhodanese-related sulfurtransferase